MLPLLIKNLQIAIKYLFLKTFLKNRIFQGVFILFQMTVSGQELLTMMGANYFWNLNQYENRLWNLWTPAIEFSEINSEINRERL